jgi:hypothetical protein
VVSHYGKTKVRIIEIRYDPHDQTIVERGHVLDLVKDDPSPLGKLLDRRLIRAEDLCNPRVITTSVVVVTTG